MTDENENPFPPVAFSVMEQTDGLWLVNVTVQAKTVARFYLHHSDAATVCAAARVQILNCFLVGCGFATKRVPEDYVDFW